MDNRTACGGSSDRGVTGAHRKAPYRTAVLKLGSLGGVGVLGVTVSPLEEETSATISDAQEQEEGEG